MADDFIELRAQRCIGGCNRFIEALAEQGFSVSTRVKHRIISQAGNDVGIEILDEPGKCLSGWVSCNYPINYRFVQQGARVRAYIV
jgi:hypothetical protein